MIRFSILAIASALLGGAMMPTVVHAALFNIVSSGSTGFASNDVVPNAGIIGLPSTLSKGWLEVAGAGSLDVQVWYLGGESGYDDTFVATTGAPVISKTDENNYGPISIGPGPGGASRTFSTKLDLGSFSQTAGNVDFKFLANGGSNGNVNNMLRTAPGTESIMFAYLTSAGAYSATATAWVLFGLNDGYNGDDNHDDWVGIMHVTPIPGAILLFGPALAGLAWMRRRRLEGHVTKLAA